MHLVGILKRCSVKKNARNEKLNKGVTLMANSWRYYERNRRHNFGNPDNTISTNFFKTKISKEYITSKYRLSKEYKETTDHLASGRSWQRWNT